jgi:hypothetical protein
MDILWRGDQRHEAATVTLVVLAFLAHQRLIIATDRNTDNCDCLYSRSVPAAPMSPTTSKEGELVRSKQEIFGNSILIRFSQQRYRTHGIGRLFAQHHRKRQRQRVQSTMNLQAEGGVTLGAQRKN